MCVCLQARRTHAQIMAQVESAHPQMSTAMPPDQVSEHAALDRIALANTLAANILGRCARWQGGACVLGRYGGGAQVGRWCARWQDRACHGGQVIGGRARIDRVKHAFQVPLLQHAQHSAVKLLPGGVVNMWDSVGNTIVLASAALAILTGKVSDKT